MNNLFFDIECANTKDGICKICSFGYIITDSNFNILKKEDLIINPESQFDWYFFKKDSNIKLAYPKETYLEYPNFKDQFSKISNILTNSYDTIYGYSVSSDVRFIKQSIERYGLNEIEINAVDVLDLSKKLGGYTGKLSNLPEEFLKEENLDLVSHHSADDAHKTMLVLKNAIYQNKKTQPDEN